MRRVGRAALLLLAVASPGSALAQRAGRSAIGDSLTSREFWQFFTTMSEEGGTFPSENLVSNEKTYQYVVPTLQRTLTPNGVYLGVGPEQNFTYIAQLAPKLAVILDIRRQNAMLHLMYKALFELSATRADFVSRLFSRPLPSVLASSATPDQIFVAIANAPANDSAFESNWQAIVRRLTVTRAFPMSGADLGSMRRVFEAFREAGPAISYAYRLGAPMPTVTEWHVTYAQLQAVTNADSVNMAFLANEETYRSIRSLQSRNLIVPVVGDFGGAKAIRAIATYLEQHRAVVTAFYTSNVEQYLFNGTAAERFYGNVTTLPIDSTSVFIRAVPNPGSVRLPAGLLPANAASVRLVINDSAGSTIYIATITDSAGRVETRRALVTGPLPVTLASSSAFISGIAPIRGALDAFAGGRLRTYRDVTVQTKTDGWR